MQRCVTYSCFTWVLNYFLHCNFNEDCGCNAFNLSLCICPYNLYVWGHSYSSARVTYIINIQYRSFECWVIDTLIGVFSLIFLIIFKCDPGKFEHSEMLSRETKEREREIKAKTKYLRNIPKVTVNVDRWKLECNPLLKLCFVCIKLVHLRKRPVTWLTRLESIMVNS